MTQLTDFLLADGKIPNGNTFGQIMSQNNSTFEMAHDNIQWMFPLPEASMCQPHSPILTRAEFDQLKAGYFHLDRLVSAKRYMLDFLNTFDLWMVPQNHNHLRITRIIKCASLFRGPIYAEDFRHMVWKFLRDSGRADAITDTTMLYWLQAVGYAKTKEITEWKS